MKSKLLKHYAKSLYQGIDYVLLSDNNGNKTSNEYYDTKQNLVSNGIELLHITDTFLEKYHVNNNFLIKSLTGLLLSTKKEKNDIENIGMDLAKISLMLGIDNLENNKLLTEDKDKDYKDHATLETGLIHDLRDTESQTSYREMYTKLDEKYKYNVIDNMFFTVPLMGLLTKQETHKVTKILSRLNGNGYITLTESKTNSKFTVDTIGGLLYSTVVSIIKKKNIKPTKEDLYSLKIDLDLLGTLYDIQKELLVKFSNQD